MGDEFDGDHLPVACALVPRGDDDVLRDAPVFGHHDGHAVFHAQPPHDALLAAFQYFDDFAFGTPPVILARQPHQHGIAMQRRAHGVRAEENVRARMVVADEKAETVRMPLNDAFDERGLVRQDERIAAIAQQLPIAFHGVQAALEKGGLLGADFQQGA